MTDDGTGLEQQQQRKSHEWWRGNFATQQRIFFVQLKVVDCWRLESLCAPSRTKRGRVLSSAQGSCQNSETWGWTVCCVLWLWLCQTVTVIGGPERLCERCVHGESAFLARRRRIGRVWKLSGLYITVRLQCCRHSGAEQSRGGGGQNLQV